MSFKVELSRQTKKFLKDDRIFREIVLLEQNPVPYYVKSLKGRPHCFCIRVGKYRILYSINYGTRTVYVFKIDKRSRAY